MRNRKEQPIRTTLPASWHHALTFNFIKGMEFNEQFTARFQPLRTTSDEALRIISVKDIQLSKRHHDEIEGCVRPVITNILVDIINIQISGMRLLSCPLFYGGR